MPDDTEPKLPRRILYVASPPLFSGGASAIHVMKMCQAMSRLGIRARLVIPSYDERENPFEYYGVLPDFQISTLPRSPVARHIAHGAAAALATLMGRGTFDLAVTRNIVFAYLAAVFLQVPTVYDAHHPLVNRAARFLFDSFKDSKYLVRFTTNSAGLGAIYLSLGLPREKLVVAPNGVDLDKFDNLPEKESARAALGLPNDKKIVCYAGNTYQGRGIETLAAIAAEMRDALFLVVGGLEADNQKYRKLAESLGAANFILTGFVPHKSVPLYLAASDALVMPYTSAMTIKGGTAAADFTSPIKLFEYMAARRPIVATSIPSLGEILEDGKNAILVAPDSRDALLEGIESALGNPDLAEKLAGRARREVAQYTWEQRVKKILCGL
ncbi:MAG: glycosyltransferase family 4 protein [Deltaproteobacteria bacterium]